MRLQELLWEYSDNDLFESVSKEIMLVLPIEIKPPDRNEGSAQYIIMFPDSKDWAFLFAYHRSNLIPDHIRDNLKQPYAQLQAVWLNSKDWKAMTLSELVDYHREITV